MNFKKGDIVTRNNAECETLWLSVDLIIDVTGVSDGYLRRVRSAYKKSVQPCHRHHNIMPDTSKSWRYGKINGQIYFDLQSLPNRQPTYYRDMFGDKSQLLNNYSQFINNNSKTSLETHFKQYLNTVYKDFIPCYLDCTKTQQVALAKACAILESCIKWINDNELDTSKNKIFKSYSNLLDKYDVRYLPHNYRKFKEKYLEIVEGDIAIAELIQLPRSGNNNALVHVDTEVQSWAIQLRSMGKNYSNDSIIRQVRQLCLRTGKTMPSRRWFGQNIFEKHYTKFLTASKRFGKGTTKAAIYEGYIPMKNALFAGDCWQVDATRVNLIAHKKENGDKDFLFVIAVRDVHSGDVLGYNFDYKEDRWSVINAVKMAVTETSYLPYEIVFDRFPGHNTEEAKRLFAQLEQMGVKVTFTHKATGKAGLERWFGTLQSVFMDQSEYYYGEGIKSSRLHAHRSPEYLKEVRKKAHKEGFDMYDSWKESQLVIEAYRETPFSYYSRKFKQINESPKLIHSKSEKPHVRFLEEHQISMIFGLKKAIKVKNNGLIKTEIQSAEYWYKIDDYEIFSKTERVILSYDLNDLSQVYLFKKREHLLVYLGIANEYETIQPYGPQAEFNRIAEEKARIKAIEIQKAAELEEKTQGFDEVAMLMGRYTNKDEAETAESHRLHNEANNTKDIELKRAAGSDVDTSSDSDIDLLNNSRNQY